MKEELEICVKCYDSYEKIISKLEEFGFEIIQMRSQSDIYFINCDLGQARLMIAEKD